MPLDAIRRESPDPKQALDGEYRGRLNRLAVRLETDIPPDTDLRMVMLPLLEALCDKLIGVENERE